MERKYANLWARYPSGGPLIFLKNHACFLNAHCFGGLSSPLESYAAAATAQEHKHQPYWLLLSARFSSFVSRPRSLNEPIPLTPKLFPNE